MMPDILAIISGSVVGFFLGLLGGGGSILAVPLLLYVVGLDDIHMAVGTSAVAVSFSALVSLALHARTGTVKWPCAIAFALSGSVGALFGAALGKITDGQKLLLAFAAAMIGVGISMLFRKPSAGDPDVHISPRLAARLIPTGVITGMASGFFGIGGGFLIVPGLIGATNMTILNAVGSSLLAVAAFAGATAASYAYSGLVHWPIAALFVVGGAAGGAAGQAVSRRLAENKGLLMRIFAGFIFATAVYIILRTVG